MAGAARRKDLSEFERNNIASWLLINSTNCKLRHGAKKEAAQLFKIDLKTVWRIWKAASAQKALGQTIHVKSMKKGAVHKDKWKLDEEKLRNMSILERSSMSKVAIRLGVSVPLIHHWKKLKYIIPVTNHVKPYLTPKNMIARLKWSLSMLSYISSSGRITFHNMYNIIHIDEKWFNLSKSVQRYYKLADEEDPYRTCKSKSNKLKIMFLYAIGRPIYAANGDVIFDGKYGIFPFIFKEPAKKNSKNRPKGTILTKPIESITKVVMKNIFINQLVPVIKQKCPKEHRMHIIIQQDNARPHISNTDPDFQAVAQSDGFNIQIRCQPANSPDTNVNDLGFFRAIQTLKDEKLATTVDGLIKNVEDAFEEYEVEKINDVFLSLQRCYHEIIKCKGSNDYKQPHTGKDRLKRLGILPECLEVEEELVRESMEYLQEQGHEPGEIYTLETLVDGMQQVFLTD